MNAVNQASVACILSTLLISACICTGSDEPLQEYVEKTTTTKATSSTTTSSTSTTTTAPTTSTTTSYTTTTQTTTSTVEKISCYSVKEPSPKSCSEAECEMGLTCRFKVTKTQCCDVVPGCVCM